MKFFKIIAIIASLALLGGCSKSKEEASTEVEAEPAVVAEVPATQPAPAATQEVKQAVAETAPLFTTNEQGQRLVRVATIEGIEKNNEFRSNLALMQSQRQQVVLVKTKLDQSKDPAEREKLQTALDTLVAKLNEDNKLMLKTYGFTLSRNYVYSIEKSEIHMEVTASEFSKMAKK